MIVMPSSLKTSGSTTRWRRLRAYVIRRDNGLCWLCNRPGADTADHVIPRVHGGTDNLDNLKAAHSLCNLRKGSRLTTGQTRGLQPQVSRDW